MSITTILQLFQGSSAEIGHSHGVSKSGSTAMRRDPILMAPSLKIISYEKKVILSLPETNACASDPPLDENDASKSISPLSFLLSIERVPEKRTLAFYMTVNHSLPLSFSHVLSLPLYLSFHFYL